MAHKERLVLHCVDCGRVEVVTDYHSRYQGDYRCRGCFEKWYAKQPAPVVKLYDIMAGEYIERI